MTDLDQYESTQRQEETIPRFPHRIVTNKDKQIRGIAQGLAETGTVLLGQYPETARVKNCQLLVVWTGTFGRRANTRPGGDSFPPLTDDHHLPCPCKVARNHPVHVHASRKVTGIERHHMLTSGVSPGDQGCRLPAQNIIYRDGDGNCTGEVKAHLRFRVEGIGVVLVKREGNGHPPQVIIDRYGGINMKGKRESNCALRSIIAPDKQIRLVRSSFQSGREERDGRRPGGARRDKAN